MIEWITVELAMAMHDRQLAEHGGGDGVRDIKLLEAALARPQQLHAYGDPPPDLAALAASLTVGIAKNHPFVDGNKRTAAVACEVFIILNGGELHANDEDLYQVYFDVASGAMCEAELCEFLRNHIRTSPDNAVQDERGRYAAA